MDRDAALWAVGHSLFACFSRGAHRPNENKMSDGWRESASLWVEGDVSCKVRDQSCQPFAPSHG
jgi:hypothetical protein